MIKGQRDIKHKFRLRIKGAIPEPSFYGFSIPLLGESGYQTSKLKEGFLHNVSKYWMDESNFYLSAESGRAEESVEDAHISPALGPTVKEALKDCDQELWTPLLKPRTIAALNQTYRDLTAAQIRLLMKPEFYTNGLEGQKFLKTQKFDGQGKLDILFKLRDDEQKLFDSKPETIKLCWKLVPDNKKIPSEMSQAEVVHQQTLTYITELAKHPELYNNDKSEVASFAALHEQKKKLVENYDFDESDQEIFGHPDLTCIERVETTPYVPFNIEGPLIPLGKPLFLRLFLKSSPRGMERSRFHIDLGNRLRMTFEQGQNIKVVRKRTDVEVEKKLKQLLEESLTSSSEIDRLKKEYASMNSVEAGEEQLEAMELSTLLYDSYQNGTPSYSGVMAKIDQQRRDIEDIKSKITEIKKKWRDAKKVAPGRKLSDLQAATRKKEIDAQKKIITDKKKNLGRDEVVRKRISRYKKILYSQEETVILSNSEGFVESPLVVKIIDYGYGLVCFEFNGGKDIFVFKDKEIIKENLNLKRKLASGHSIKVIDEDSYEWLVAKDRPNAQGKQSPGRIRLSGTGGSFFFAIDSAIVGKGEAYIPFLTDQPISVIEGKVAQEIDSVLVTNLPGYGPASSVVSGKGEVTSAGGRISTELVLPYPGNLEFLPKTMDELIKLLPTYTQWFKFVGGSASGEAILDPQKNKYNLVYVKVTFEPVNDSIPILFRGFMNVLAIPRCWDETDEVIGDNDLSNNYAVYPDASPYPLVSDDETENAGVDVLHLLTPDDWVIKVQPGFDAEKRRKSFQIVLNRRGDKPATEAQNRLPDMLPGKRMDIEYQYPRSSNNSINWHRVATDLYITEAMNENLRTITQPRDYMAGFPIGGYFHLKETETTINAHDFIRVTEDSQVRERLVLEGYSFQRALNVLLRNGGIPTKRLRNLNPTIIRGTYTRLSQNSEEVYLPIALPGQKHSFMYDDNYSRSQALSILSDKYGILTEGNRALVVDRNGMLFLEGPFSIGWDPRFNKKIILKSHRKSILKQQEIEGASPTTENQLEWNRLASHIYINEIKRRKTMDGFASLIKLIGAPDPVTGKRLTVGVQKHEAVNRKYKNQSIFTGHHIEATPMVLDDVRTQEELIARIRYEYNKRTYMREFWDVSSTYNPFIDPGSIIFLEPDSQGKQPNHEGGASGTVDLDGGNLSYMVQCAWRVIDVYPDLLNDKMQISMVNLTKAEKEYLYGLLQKGGNGVIR